MKTIHAADLFCGAGGTSTGLLNAARSLGYQVDLLAINHWQIAIATHSANHPDADHRCESLDNVDPRKLVPDGKLDLLVASPECTHHSRARGGKPISDQSRASAWHVLRWCEALDVRNVLIENVPEFQDWGPLDKNDRPIKRQKGRIYRAFLSAMRALGYSVDARIINAADYGDPTTRKRLFIVATKGRKVRWPEPTHSQTGGDMFGERPKWKPAREIIDWSLKGESIFNRKKPLSPNTIKRIEAGLRKYGGLPFVLGQQSAASPRATDKPLPTIASAGAISLIQPFIVPVNHGTGDLRTHSLNDPMPTVTGFDALALAEPFLIEYNGTGGPESINEPLNTITGSDRFGLVQPYIFKDDSGQIYMLDIRFRMLQPHELARAMSFPKDYKFIGNREQMVKQIGNAIPIETATALCRTLIL